jgi:hypothetical protein
VVVSGAVFSFESFRFPLGSLVTHRLHRDTFTPSQQQQSLEHFVKPFSSKVIVVHYSVWQCLLSGSCSSVSILSDYGLDGWAIEVRSRQRRKDFYSSLCAQSGFGTHPASCIMDNAAPILGATARPGRDADHSPPSSAEVENEWELYLLSPPSAFVACSGTAKKSVLNLRNHLRIIGSWSCFSLLCS